MPTSSRPPHESYASIDASRDRARTHRTSRRSFVVPLLALACIAAIAVGAYYFVQYQRLKSDPTLEARKEAERVVKELSKIMVVPDDPAPVLATVSDRDQLQDQPFFRQAENGDQVVIFPSSMRAVLYRPSEKRVVDMAPLTTDASASAQPAPPASVADDTASDDSTL